ncbi:MAG: chromosome segregation protein SMC [Saprospiraceae bacterium]|nr:chromosome segregation protein SMC [Saprospiraceae bacterium]
MKLSKLEIKGFKSFANDTVIYFNEAITGIVGPNGSGKSNIVDAIRWVLGEQKGKELRLEQMSDVIFNGTKKKKEAPMASVTLSFENTKQILPIEYQNIAISRLLYRSGESEYRINNVPCRLKDITSIFMDTGIGADSYAIIALGMVEDLLSNKESARRKMFEQAAGISKYKSRKRESINKLKATTEDLARIEDLLFEINNNLVELEKQAKRAKRFYEMRDKYRQTGLKLSVITVGTLKEKIGLLTQKIDQGIEILSEKETELRVKEAETEQFKKNHLDKEKSLGEYQKKANELLDKIRSIETEIQVYTQKKWFAATQIEQLSNTESELNNKSEVLIQDLLLLDTQIERTKLEFDRLNAESVNLEEDLKHKQEKYDSLKSMADNDSEFKSKLEKEIFDLEKRLAIDNNQVENLELDIQRCKSEMASKQSDLKNILEEKAKLELKYSELTKIIQKTVQEEEERKLLLSQKKKILEERTSQTALQTRKRDSKKNEFDLLKSMIEKMEGFPESSIFLSQNWKKDTPILLDLIYTDEKYRPAIEFYLEPFLNYLVVKTEEDAIQAIKLLYGNAKGKANFFILGKIIESNNPTTVELPNCRHAFDLIETDSMYTPLFKNLLHNVYVIDKEGNLDEIIKYPDNHTVITLSGSIIKKNSIIIGGSVGLFEGKKLGRKKNLEKLEIEIKEIDREVFELEKSLGDLKNEIKNIELNNQENELNKFRKEESVFLQSLAQIETKQNNISELQLQLSNRISESENQKIEIEKRSFNQMTVLSELKNKLEIILQKIFSTDQLFGQVSSELSLSSTVFNQSKLETIKWENKYENLIKDKQFKDNLSSEYKKQSGINQLKLKDFNADVIKLKENILTFTTQLEEQYAFKKLFENDLSLMEQEYLEIRNQISTKENAIKEINRLIAEMQLNINNIKDERSNHNYKIQSTYERAELEFSMKLEEYVAEEEIETMDEDQLRDRVQYYKVRLDNYGEINPLALEAYDEMKTRYDNIQIQKTDILTAQESLLQTIKEIEQTATESFLVAFNQVRTHFQDVFRSLFTSDDDCDLVLMDEMDPLECDIDIIAKPKGKRPKSIHQLSGGEKTLTAIALLFSLYLLKPAPFCIFDEVDAPLDDINIDKFNRIIRLFSKDSQFVIITHNKLTMAEVDVLYGVYMEEPGISNVTAVDFRTYSHEVTLSEMEA